MNELEADLRSRIIGSVVRQMRYMTKRELENYGWDETQQGIIITLSKNLKLVLSRDPEGNGPGFVFVEDTKTGESHYPPMPPHKTH